MGCANVHNSCIKTYFAKNKVLPMVLASFSPTTEHTEQHIYSQTNREFREYEQVVENFI